MRAALESMRTLALLLGMALAAVHPLAAASSIQVVNLDGDGEGLNDPTPFTPVGGNPATTRCTSRLVRTGQARPVKLSTSESRQEPDMASRCYEEQAELAPPGCSNRGQACCLEAW